MSISILVARNSAEADLLTSWAMTALALGDQPAFAVLCDGHLLV
jgi:hypothetical protein